MRLFGIRPVIERLNSEPKSIETIYFQEGSELKDIIKLAKHKDIPYQLLPFRRFNNLTKNVVAQGVFASVKPYEYAYLEDFLDSPNGQKPTLIFLDGITDPQNFGSMLRTAACFGKFCFVLPKHRSVEVNETVLRIACGGENYIPVVKIVNLFQGILQAKEAGFTIIGAVAEPAESLEEINFTFPVGLVVGSEGKGISHNIANHLDAKVNIPMKGSRLSFNASIALAIICYKISCQKS